MCNHSPAPGHNRSIIVATVLLGLVLAGCGSGATPANSPGTGNSPKFCDTYRSIRTKVNEAANQLTPTQNTQTVQASLDTIAKQVKIGLDASPPAAVKGSLQTFYDAVLKTQDELAAIAYDTTKLQKPLTLVDPKTQQAGKTIEEWGHANCGTTLSTNAPQLSPGPTR